VHQADHAKDTMSRPSLSFLRPYLYPSARCLRADHARAYLSVQRRFSQIAAEKHTGPHDVEKQKRLEQLGRVKALDNYHPRLQQPSGAEKLSIRDFNAKYEAIEETKPEMVSVLGTKTAQAP
jgi:lysyl-tRNA synthetase class 2